WIGEPAVAELIEGPLSNAGIENPTVLHSIAFAIAFSIITLAHVVVGELAPKSVAIRYPAETTTRVARPMVFFYWISWPFMKVFNGAALLLLKAIGIPAATPTESAHTEQEIETLLSRVGEAQVSSRVAREVLSNVFWLRRLTTRQVMTHRTQVVALDLQAELTENLEHARRSGFARFPVVDGSIDRVVGIIHLKDLAFLDDGASSEVLRQLAHPPVILPETMPLDQALTALLDAKAKLAVVADEHGGTEGVVTTEDILEELIGEMEDAFDEESPDAVPLPDGRLLVRGDAALHDLEDRLGLESGDPDVSTVGGLMTARLGRVPSRGEGLVIEGWRLTATDVTKRRVLQLIAQEAEPEPAEDPEEPWTEGSE
ncbi:MAG: hemolysin family protein, partial [Candidatus Thermoplasmatota archaeon]|nr:hemolysin family protein [Candidatus Thermoplasmatota archaeon]